MKKPICILKKSQINKFSLQIDKIMTLIFSIFLQFLFTFTQATNFKRSYNSFVISNDNLIEPDTLEKTTTSKEFVKIGTLVNKIINEPKLETAIDCLNKMVYIEDGSIQFDKKSIIIGASIIVVTFLALAITTVAALIKNFCLKKYLCSLNYDQV